MRRFCGLIVFLSAASVHAAPDPQRADALHLNIAWQVALDRVGFSPGIIDGRIGPKTELATREFQRVRGLPTTGRLDSATHAALRIDVAGALTRHVVSSADVEAVGPAPKDWLARSRLSHLGYESVAAAVAERYHCSMGLLTRLNPAVNIAALGPGDTLTVPAVEAVWASPAAHCLEINLHEKVIRALNANRELVALFHCSIAKDKEKLPAGETRVAVVTENPSYTFDPRMWPEVKGIDRKLLIPPGPRNPVGRCWIGLGLPGYGIHGSPNPELIGKTGSHGCFRLTNWDALRLGKMIREGATVRFVGAAQLAAADGKRGTSR